MMKIFAKILRAIVVILAIIVLAPFCLTFISMLVEGHEGAAYLVELALAFVIAWYLNIIVHEGGHFVFGLFCGYRFCSFRVGSIMLVKQGGKLKFRQFELAGTGGQCLMIPPEKDETPAQIILYNLGGAIFNLILAIICGVLHKVFPDLYLLSTTLWVSAVLSVLNMLVNGIPLNAGGIANDGMNALHLSKNPEAAVSFRKALLINAAQTEGALTSNMPDEWFSLPEGADMQNPHNVALAVFDAGRPFFNGDTLAVEQATERLLNSNYNLIGLYRNLLTVDLIYCRLVNGSGEVKKYLTPVMRKFMKAMKNHPMVIRTEYAIALLVDRDEKAAANILSSFEKNAPKYPYQQEIDLERMLMSKALEKSKNNT